MREGTRPKPGGKNIQTSNIREEVFGRSYPLLSKATDKSVGIASYYSNKAKSLM